MRNDKENIIVDKTFAFACKIISITDQIYQDRRFHFANQLFKSGTSIGANVAESQNAESDRDFIHKMKIAAKETDETIFWLRLAEKIGYGVKELLLDCKEILRILSKIISTTKRKLSNNIFEIGVSSHT